MSTTESTRELVVVLEGAAACRFREGDALNFRYRLETGMASLVFTNRYRKEGLESAVPREFVCVVASGASDVEEAAASAAKHANMTAAIIAIATNATVEEMQPVIVYDRYPMKGRREFFQSQVTPETGLPRRARLVRSDLVLAVIDALTSSPESERLHRAATHYNRALASWRPGRETLVLTPLWMAAETLTDVALRAELMNTGLDERGLAASWGINVDQPAREWRTKLTAETRLRRIFQGDSPTYSNAKKASDGWEHGFLSFDEVRTVAEECSDTTARYVREAFLRLTHTESSAMAELLQEPFSRPRQYFPYARYLRGWLVGEAEEPAGDGDAYPFMEWQYRLSKFIQRTVGGYEVSFEDTISPHISDSLSFQGTSIQVWGPASDDE